MAKTFTKTTSLQRYRNIAKSFGYAAIDVAADLNPALGRLGKETKFVVSDAVSTIKSIDRDSVSKSVRDFLDPNGQNMIANTISDLKTGNWYNKDRENAMFDDMDFDFDDDFGDEEDESSSESTASEMISGMQSLSGDLAVSVGRSSALSAEYIAESSHRDSLAHYDLNKAGFSSISNMLISIDHKFDMMIEMQAPMVQQSQNAYVFQTRATEFFENTNETLNKMNASLERLVENTNLLNPNYTPRSSAGRDKSLGSLIMGDEFDFGAYFDMVKQNAKDQADMIKSLASMGAMVAGKNGKNISPMALAMTGAMKAMIPEAVKESMKALNETVDASIPMLLKSLKDASKGSFIKSFLADIFLPDMSVKSNIDKSKYEKNAVPWDGVSRKALVEVIPGYLAEIASALTGKEARHYDYNRGVFRSTSDIRGEHNRMRLQESVYSGGDFRQNALRSTDSKAMQEKLSKYFINALGYNGNIDPRQGKRSASEYQKFLADMGIDAQTADLLARAIAKDTRSYRKYNSNLLSSQTRLNNYYKNEEVSGRSNLRYLNNGLENAFDSQEDKFKMTQSDYMHGIYETVNKIYDAMSGTSGGRRGRRRRSQNREASNMDTRESRAERRHPTSTFDALYEGLTRDDMKKLYMTDEEREQFDQMQRYREEAKKYTDKAKGWVQSVVNKVRNFGRRHITHTEERTVEEDAESSPFTAATNLINKITEGIEEIFWGDNGEKGIIETIKSKFESAFDDIKQKAKEFFTDSLKTLWSPIKDKGLQLWGDIREGFTANKSKRYLLGQGYSEEEATEQGNKIAATKRRLLDERARKERERKARERETAAETAPIEGAATGRKVTKTGLIAVSEGELIIPSEFNPFYRGKTDKARQIRNEQRVIDRFYGSYVEGGTVADKARDIAGKAKGKIDEASEMFNSKFGGVDREFAHKLGSTANDAATMVGMGVSKFMSRIMGDMSDKNIEDQKKKISEGISNVMKDMGVSTKRMGAGAIAGVGVSLLTGAVVGPLAGAAIGAAAGLVSNSKTLQKLLFGELIVDEDGNEIDKRTFIGKAKDTIMEGAKSAIGKVSAKLITPENLIGISAGALIGGPFGAFGGIILASAGKFEGIAQRFQTFMFGDPNETRNPEADTSLTGIIRNKIVFNLDELFHNSLNAVKGLFKDLNTSLTHHVKNLFEDIKKKVATSRIGRAAKSAMKFGADKIGGLVKAPFSIVGDALGGANRMLQRSNLKHGYNIYNRKERRNMTAEERVAAREKLGLNSGLRGLNAKYREGTVLDETLSTLTDEELFELQDEIKAMQGSDTAEKHIVNQNMAKLYGSIKDNNIAFDKMGDKKQFDKLVRAGRGNEAVDFLVKKGYDAEKIRELVNQTATSNTDQLTIKKAIQEKKDELAAKGINLETDVKGRRAIDLINDEISAKGLTREGIEQAKKEDELEKDQNDRDASLFGLLSSIADSLDDKLDPMSLLKGKFRALSTYNMQRRIDKARSDQNRTSDVNSMIDNTNENISNNSAGNIKDEGTEHVEYTDYGIIRYSRNPQTGEIKERSDDAETDATQQRRDKFFKSINELPLIGGVVNKIGGLFGSLHDKLFGSKDDPEKKGIFSKLFDFITGGATSIFSKITEFFTGTSIGQALKTIGGNLTFGNVLGGIVGPGLMAAAFTGLFDEWFNKLFGHIDLLKGNDPSTQGAFADDKIESQTVDENGNITTNTIHAGFDNSLSNNLRRNLVSTTIRGLARGGKSIGGVAAAAMRKGKSVFTNKILAGTKLGANMAKNGILRGGMQTIYEGVASSATKKAASLHERALKAIGNNADNAAKLVGKEMAQTSKAASASKVAANFAEKGMMEGVLSAISEGLGKLPDVVKKIPFLPASLKNNIDDIVLQLYTHLDDALKGAGKKLGTIATKIADIMPLINIAYSVAVGINAWGDAESILGITDKASFGQKCIATLIAVVNSLIPFVGDLIPNNVLVNIFMKILPTIGIDVSSLEQQREEAEKTVAEYNAEHGTDYNISQYNEIVQGRAGVFRKGWHAVQNTVSGIKNKIKDAGGIKNFAKQSISKVGESAKNLATSIKENGIAGTAQNMIDKISEYEPTSGLGKAAKTAWDAFGSKLAQIKLLAMKGDVKGLLDYKAPNATESGIEKIINVGFGIYKYMNLPIATISWVSHKLFDGIKAVGTTIAKEVSQNWAVADKIKEQSKTGDIKALWDTDISSVATEDNPIGGFQKFTAVANKILYSIPTLIIGAGKKIGEWITGTVNKVKTNIKAAQDGFKYGWETIHDKNSSLADMFKIEEPDPENPIGGFTKGIIFASRLTAIPAAMIAKVGSNIADWVKGKIDSIKSEAKQYMDINNTIKDQVKTGDVDALWNTDISSAGSDENPIGGIQKALAFGNKLLYTIPTFVVGIGKGIGEWASGVWNTIKSETKQYLDITTSIKDKVKDGDVEALWNTDISGAGSDENPIGGIQKALAFGNKLMYTIPTFVVGIGKGIGDWFKGIVDKTKSNHSKFTEVMDKLSKHAEEGNLSAIWTEDNPYDQSDPLHNIWNIGTTISRLFNSAVAIFHKLAGPIEALVNKVKEKVQPLVDTAEAVGEWWGGKVEGVKEGVKEGVNSAKNWVGDKLSGVYNNARNFVTGGSSFINQRANSYAKRGFANSTFGEKGCGPAVASMAASALGKNMSLGSAVSRSRGYQNANGVDIGYFGDALGQSGISTQYVSGAGAADQLANGNKVILLGQDARNTSKARSPFGPGNHYVLATGMRNGKVMINDPENNGPKAYSPSILNNVKLGVAASGARLNRTLGGKRKGFFRGLLSGAGSDSNISQIWGFLKNKGLSDVAIAGLMGCWENESTNSPDVLEGNYKLKENSDTVMASNEAMNAYTTKLFDMYKKSGISINQSAYKGADGQFYPGYGLGQWTGPRQYNLVQFAKQNGMDHRDLATQLEFFWQEYQSKPALQEALSKAETVEDATAAALDHYEMNNSSWHTTDRGAKQLSKRIAAAKDIFSKMEGQEGTLPTAGVHGESTGAVDELAGEANTTGTTTGTAEGGEKKKKFSIFNFISEFSSLWSKAFSGQKDEESSSSSTGMSGSVSGSTGEYGSSEAIGDVGATTLSGSPSEIMKGILGKIEYSMKGPRNPEKGSADCSSTVQWAIRKAGGPDIGGNTGAQYNNSNLTPVWHQGGSYAEAVPEEAQKDDVMFFARPGGSSDKGAQLDHVGHVGIYMGGNQYIHHGSGKGPKIKEFAPKDKLIKISRVIDPNAEVAEDQNTEQPASASARRSKAFNEAHDIRNEAAMGSGLSGGASDMFGTVNMVGSALGGVLNGSSSGSSGGGGVGGKSNVDRTKRIDPLLANNVYELLMKVFSGAENGSFSKLLQNASYVAKIVEILQNMTAASANGNMSKLAGGDSGINNNTKSTSGGRNSLSGSSIPTSFDEVDSDIVQLAETLAALAKG